MKRRAQPWLGTLVEIGIADLLGDAELTRCFNDAFAAIGLVQRLMSFHDAASDVSRINRAAVGQGIDIDAHTCEVIRHALLIADATDGLFDISCAPQLVAWGYLPHGNDEMPDYRPGTATLILGPDNRINKTGPTWIDLGGIAKGYAVDLAIRVLQERGVRSACVNAGGDLRAFGEITYPVAIRHPERPGAAGRQVLLQDQALATSGTYFSRKLIGPLETSAIVNGKDGQPVTRRISASVLAPTCILADALTKVVIAGADPSHPALAQYGASAFII